MNKHKILFYLAQEYYWPSLEPIYNEFAKEENRYELYLQTGKNQERFLKFFLKSNKRRIEKKFISSGYKIADHTDGFDMVFCGAQIKNPERFKGAVLCNVDHGPGIKTLRYRHLLKQKKTKYVCFLEGKYRLNKFKKYGLDKIHRIYDTGLPKLDVFFNNKFNREELLKKCRLDPFRKTILYAPSYKPTSIFLISDDIEKLADKYNIIIKLHPYSWSGKYAPHSQHKVFEKIAKNRKNMFLVNAADHNILPYMYVSDTMISDGSSVINEYLALNRCGIIVDLPEEQHRDGTPLLEEKSSNWLKQGYIHVDPENADIFKAVETALNPDDKRKKQIEKDKNYIFSCTDGQSAQRVKMISEELLNE